MEIKKDEKSIVSTILTEGKSDWKHLKRAMEKLNIYMDISFHEDEKVTGETMLLRLCEDFSEIPQEKPFIFIFDRDNPKTVKQVTHKDKRFKYWGNNVYSFAIPVPSFREGYENISIEFYYKDDEIKTEDKEGRRLFLSSEFIESSSRHILDPNISYGNIHKLKNKTEPKKAMIIDSKVFNSENRNIALSKSSFAENILHGVPPFDNFDFSEFRKIFDIIKSIIIDIDSKSTIGSDAVVKIPVRINGTTKEILKDHPPAIPGFVGRSEYIEKLLDTKIRVAAITGLGGEGKSSLAAKLYQMAVKGETKGKFIKFGWCDFKDLENPLHDKLLSLLEDLTDEEQTKLKYSDENIDDTIYRFVNCLNSKDYFIVFDNVDGFVDKNFYMFTGKLKTIFDQLVSKLTSSIVIFTCRSAITDHHFSFLEVPIEGLSYFETHELAKNFNIINKKVSDSDINYIHQKTKGHALWLNIIFAQLRNDRINPNKIQKIFSKHPDILDIHILSSIWNTLTDNEKEIIWTISTFVRPHDINKIERASNMTYQKCSRILGTLTRLKLILEVDVAGETYYDLHPIIKMKARWECETKKKVNLLNRVIRVLSFGDWNKLDSMMQASDKYPFEIERYVECAEIALENKNHKLAIEYIDNLEEPLRKYGEDSKFIKLCCQLFEDIDPDEYEIGTQHKLSSIFEAYINSLLEQGEFAQVDSHLSDLQKNIKTIQQYKFYSKMQGYNFWFQDRFPEAVEFMEDAMRRFKEKGETVSDIQYHLALARRDIGRVDEALQFFLSRTELETIETWDPDSGDDFSADAGNISRCYYLKKQYDKSLEFCEKSVHFLEKGQTRQNKVNYGYGLLWIADVYIKLKRFEEAVDYVNKTIDAWKKYCPSRLKKIQGHIDKYPPSFKKKYSIEIPQM